MRGLGQSDRVALIISECQRGVIEPEFAMFGGLVEQVAERGIVSKIAALASQFRALGLPVLHAHVAHNKDYVGMPRTSLVVSLAAKMGAMQVGSEGVEPVPELAPEEGDIVHTRSFALVGFHGTDLDSQLRHRGITTLVMVGVSSNIAIPGMALCASDLGYQVIVPEDCIAGASAETHAFSIEHNLPLYSTLTTSDALVKALQER